VHHLTSAGGPFKAAELLPKFTRWFFGHGAAASFLEPGGPTPAACLGGIHD
jgi:hypothetical protein